MGDLPEHPESDSSRLTLVAFSDLHMWRFGWDWDFSPKCMLGLTNLALRRARHYPIAAQLAMIERLTNEQADHVLFAGDLTTTSLRSEFEQGQMILAPLMLRWHDRFHAIPGNHDRYTPRAARMRLYERLFLGRDQDYPYTVRLGEHWSLVAFDCAIPRWFSSRGHMGEEAIERLGEELARESSAGRRIIAMGHYPLVYPKRIWASWEHVLPERDRLLEILERHGVQLYIHGHKHRRWLVKTGSLLHANCGSAGMDHPSRGRRPGYIRMELNAGDVKKIEAVALGPNWSAAHPTGEGAWLNEPLIIE